MSIWQSKVVRSTTAVFVLGLVFQTVFFYSIFDVYFQSPLVTGVPSVQVPSGAPAKRLVLFVADGLRAASFFERKPDGTPRAPYLRSVIEHRGSWGVSHTRVPTESRPGHVALLAGFYEDVSAVTKGWAANPVEFDSVINQSRVTVALGSPDIVPMFVDEVPHAHGLTYDAAMEDFALASSSVSLDDWVFDRVGGILDKPGSAFPGLEPEALDGPGTLFFLHLLGIDTAGHAKKPASDEYLANIEAVDAGVERIVALFEAKYGRAEEAGTAFVFTADHGMSNRGSHGDGDPHNTQTPLVTWGAGVRRPVKLPVEARQPGRDPPGWGLDAYERKDVEQAEVASLMASLLGLRYPTNAVGLLPIEYLNVATSYKLDSLVANAAAIYQQFKVKTAAVRARVLWPAASSSSRRTDSTTSSPTTGLFS